MNATKILWGQVLLVSATVLTFVWAATEWAAWQLGFQPGLGHPWFKVFGWPVYHPSAFFWWWFAYDAYARDIFVEGAYIAAAGGIAAIVVAVTISVWRAREAKRVTTYGSARWAETREVREAGLLGHDGVLLGRWRDDYLRHDGPEHVLCFAPTRSGKGVGLVVPTLLTWPGSAIVHDIKGENWTLTAGWRARFGRVLIFDPTNAQSAAYNPLLEVRRGEWEVRDVQNIADVLVDPRRCSGKAEPLGENQSFAAGWHHPSRALRRDGQDARRRRQFSLRSETTDRDDAAGDDDHAASARGRRASRCRQRRARASEQKRE